MEEINREDKAHNVRRRARVASKTISAASHFIGVKSKDLLKLDASNFLSLKQKPLPVDTDCDVVLTFPRNTSENTLTWILARLKLRVPELKIHVRHHSHLDACVFYISESYENYLQVLEDLKFPKQLKDEYGGGLKEFIKSERKIFNGCENEENFITGQEKQAIILHKLNSLYAVSGDELEGIKFVEGQAIIPKCVTVGIIDKIVALHEYESIEKLKKSWVRAFFKCQPINDICEYFGVKIAMYFSWLGHYTQALILPAIIGIIFSFLARKSQAMEDLCFVLFAFFNVIWATLYLESWKRNSAELAYRWGTLDKEDELIVQPRPLFTGQLEKSQVTNKLEPVYPAWKRNMFRYCVTVPVIILCLFIVFIVMFLIFELQFWWDFKVKSLKYPFWLTFIPKVLLALAINFMDGVYSKLAHWLNDQENYRLEETYQNHLIIKLVMFQFVNSFLSLFYIAFYLQDMDKLRSQLAALLITRQVVGNVKESLIPFIKERMKFLKLSASKQNSESENKKNDENTSGQNDLLTQAEAECVRVPYEGTFEDYLEMFIQFGYVILFSSAFPLAGLCALLNNIIEIRSDAFKLCMIHQRPFGERVENIGTWQDALEVMGVIAVIVNCTLIGMSGLVERMFPDLSLSGIIVLIVILEHIILSLKFIVAYAIPDIPHWVATAMAKVEFSRREASKKVTPHGSLDETTYKETSCVATQTESKIDVEVISSIGRAYNMNIGPQFPDLCSVSEEVADEILNEDDLSRKLVDPQPEDTREAVVVESIQLKANKKNQRKFIPHMKNIGRSLSFDSQQFKFKFKDKEPKSPKENASPLSAPTNEAETNSPKFVFTSTTEERLPAPDTPPSLHVVDNPPENGDYSSNSHSRSKLSRIVSLKGIKKVKFHKSTSD